MPCVAAVAATTTVVLVLVWGARAYKAEAAAAEVEDDEEQEDDAPFASPTRQPPATSRRATMSDAYSYARIGPSGRGHYHRFARTLLCVLIYW